MANRFRKRFQEQSGSATVEAVVGFTGFLLAIFTILGMINFSRTQMLVSAAVDTAAKEMSQYAYFYQMSGLKAFEEEMDGNAGIGKEKINGIISTVDNLYGSITNAVEQGPKIKTEVENMTSKGKIELEKFQKAVDDVKDSAEDIGRGIQGVELAMGDIKNDPLIYMRSLVAIAGSGTLEAAKRAVAVPLARAFVSKHFGDTNAEVDKNLKSLGIEGGLKSMNFNLSTVFSDDNHRDIEIVVIYKVKLLQVFDWVVLEANVSKVACCQAWLGGDNVTTNILSDSKPTVPSTEAPPTDGEEATDPTETTTAPTEPPVDMTNSKWTSGAYSEGMPYLTHLSPDGFPVISDESTLKQDKPELYGDSGSLAKADDNTSGLLSMDIISDLHAIGQYVEIDDEEDVQRVLIYQLYVPENISDEEYEKLEDAIDLAETLIDSYVETYDNENNASGIRVAKNVEYDIEIVKIGGNYDYANGGGQ